MISPYMAPIDLELVQRKDLMIRTNFRLSFLAKIELDRLMLVLAYYNPNPSNSNSNNL